MLSHLQTCKSFQICSDTKLVLTPEIILLERSYSEKDIVYFYLVICVEPFQLLYVWQFAVEFYSTKIMHINGTDVSSYQSP